MSMTKPRIKLQPEKFKAGDVIEVKTLISHAMETGNRKDRDGNSVPRNIIHLFIATFEGSPVFRAELQPGISANPYLSFFLRVPDSGELEMAWVDDAGNRVVEKIKLSVS